MRSNYVLIIIAFLIISCNSKSKNSDLEKKENLNFSKIDISKSQPASKDYIKNLTLNKDEFLNIHFILEEPIIQSLQSLAPKLTEDELLEKGSLQFSFLVDGETVYAENLNKGAGLKAFKTKQLNHIIRLVAPKQLDYWGWFMWLKFMKLGGGQDAFSEGKHSLSIEVRPFIKQDTLKVGALLANGNIAIEVPEIPIDKSLIPLAPSLGNNK